MIELTPGQVQAIDCEKQPARAVDPSTGQVYRLVKNEVYEIMNGYLKPLGRAWDDPADDDLIQKRS